MLLIFTLIANAQNICVDSLTTRVLKLEHELAYEKESRAISDMLNECKMKILSQEVSNLQILGNVMHKGGDMDLYYTYKRSFDAGNTYLTVTQSSIIAMEYVISNSKADSSFTESEKESLFSAISRVKEYLNIYKTTLEGSYKMLEIFKDTVKKR